MKEIALSFFPFISEYIAKLVHGSGRKGLARTISVHKLEELRLKNVEKLYWLNSAICP